MKSVAAKKIDLEQLKKIHKAGAVAYVRPSSWDEFDIPEDLSGRGAQSDIKQKLEEASCSKIESMSPEAYVSLAHR